MKHTERDSAQDAAPQNDWLNAETDNHIHAMAGINPDEDEDLNEDEDLDEDDDLDEVDDTDDDDDDDDSGDWGHVDPADSPFPDSNDPTAPGSAV